MTHRTTELAVEGMTCDSCVSHVSSALSEAGADGVRVDLPTGTATFVIDDGVSADALAAAVSAAGYTPGRLRVLDEPVLDEPGAAGGHDREDGDAETARQPAAATGASTAGIDYDLVVLGAGSAAFAAAIKATDAGRTVALVESGTLGGTCVNIGCVPSKALLRAGEVAHVAAHHPFAGITTEPAKVDLAALVAAKNGLVDTLRQVKYADLVGDYGFEVISGHARFVDADTIEVDGRRIRAAAYLVATGARPVAPPVPGLAEAGYLTSTTALELDEVPGRLVVVGANAIGLELGQFFSHVGALVTFLDVAERVAPFEEPEVSAALTQVLVEGGATVHTGAQLTRVRRRGDVRVLEVTVDGRDLVIEADQVLVATGRRPNTEELGLAAAGIDVDGRGAVVVDEHLQTANPRVWAAGDVTGSPQFVYVSAYQGALAAENALLGAGRRVDLSALPRVTFTSPQVASVGVTEAAATAAGHRVKTSVLPLDAVPRALVNRDIAGLVKLVADADTDRLLGASVVADAAGEVIQSAVLAVKFGITTEQLAGTFHPYLTMVEGLKLAAQTFTRDVHRLSCCAA
jgi:mercuric reductase